MTKTGLGKKEGSGFKKNGERKEFPLDGRSRGQTVATERPERGGQRLVKKHAANDLLQDRGQMKRGTLLLMCKKNFFNGESVGNRWNGARGKGHMTKRFGKYRGLQGKHLKKGGNQHRRFGEAVTVEGKWGGGKNEPSPANRRRGEKKKSASYEDPTKRQKIGDLLRRKKGKKGIEHTAKTDLEGLNKLH